MNTSSQKVLAVFFSITCIVQADEAPDIDALFRAQIGKTKKLRDQALEEAKVSAYSEKLIPLEETYWKKWIELLEYARSSQDEELKHLFIQTEIIGELTSAYADLEYAQSPEEANEARKKIAALRLTVDQLRLGGDPVGNHKDMKRKASAEEIIINGISYEFAAHENDIDESSQRDTGGLAFIRDDKSKKQILQSWIANGARELTPYYPPRKVLDASRALLEDHGIEKDQVGEMLYYTWGSGRHVLVCLTKTDDSSVRSNCIGLDKSDQITVYWVERQAARFKTIIEEIYGKTKEQVGDANRE